MGAVDLSLGGFTDYLFTLFHASQMGAVDLSLGGFTDYLFTLFHASQMGAVDLSLGGFTDYLFTLFHASQTGAVDLSLGGFTPHVKDDSTCLSPDSSPIAGPSRQTLELSPRQYTTRNSSHCDHAHAGTHTDPHHVSGRVSYLS